MRTSLGAIILPTTGEDLLGWALREKARAHTALPWSSTNSARQGLVYQLVYPQVRRLRFRLIQYSHHTSRKLRAWCFHHAAGRTEHVDESGLDPSWPSGPALTVTIVNPQPGF